MESSFAAGKVQIAHGDSVNLGERPIGGAGPRPRLRPPTTQRKRRRALASRPVEAAARGRSTRAGSLARNGSRQARRDRRRALPAPARRGSLRDHRARERGPPGLCGSEAAIGEPTPRERRRSGPAGRAPLSLFRGGEIGPRRASSIVPRGVRDARLLSASARRGR